MPEFTFAKRREMTGPPTPGNPQVNVTLAQFTTNAKRKFGPLTEEYLKLYPAKNDDPGGTGEQRFSAR